MVNKHLAASPIMLTDPLAIDPSEVRPPPTSLKTTLTEPSIEALPEEAAPKAVEEAVDEPDGMVESAMQEEDTLSHMA